MKCCGASCKKFCRYGAFRADLYRRHSVSVNAPVGAAGTDLKCGLVLCERQCRDTEALIAHVKERVVEDPAASCPVRGCAKVFKVRAALVIYTENLLLSHVFSFFYLLRAYRTLLKRCRSDMS